MITISGTKLKPTTMTKNYKAKTVLDMFSSDNKPELRYLENGQIFTIFSMYYIDSISLGKNYIINDRKFCKEDDVIKIVDEEFMKEKKEKEKKEKEKKEREKEQVIEIKKSEVKDVILSELCYATFPCQHFVLIKMTDNTIKIPYLMGARDIYKLIKALNLQVPGHISNQVTAEKRLETVPENYTFSSDGQWFKVV